MRAYGNIQLLGLQQNFRKAMLKEVVVVKKLLSILVLGLIFVVQSHAETVYLKDGRVIKGKIVNRGVDEITIKGAGTTLEHYFNDQILRIGPDDEPAALKAEDAAPAVLSNISDEKIDLIIEFVNVSGIGYSIQENIDRIIKQAPEEKLAQ